MSKPKLSELVKKSTSDTERPSTKSGAPAEPTIPAVDAVQGGNTAIQKILKYKEIDPSKCRPWAHHNRPNVWLTPQACASLIGCATQLPLLASQAPLAHGPSSDEQSLVG